jgi:hypothetical protein
MLNSEALMQYAAFMSFVVGSRCCAKACVASVNATASTPVNKDLRISLSLSMSDTDGAFIVAMIPAATTPPHHAPGHAARCGRNTSRVVAGSTRRVRARRDRALPAAGGRRRYSAASREERDPRAQAPRRGSLSSRRCSVAMEFLDFHPHPCARQSLS